MFPWLGQWIKSRGRMMKLVDQNVKDVMDLVRGLKDTLNPQMCRGFVDSFLARKQKLEVWYSIF